MEGKCLNQIAEGCRLWTEWGLHEHGRDRVSVSAKTGGTLVRKWKEFYSMDNYLYTIKWDTGQTSIHYSNTLPQCIVKCKTMAEFESEVLAQAARYELVGGKFNGKVVLRSGDWVEGMWRMEARLKEANVRVRIRLK